MKASCAALLILMASPALGQPSAAETDKPRRHPLLQPGENWPRFDRPRILSAPDWSNPGLYPPAARSADVEGAVTFDVHVGADGLPLACRIVQSSGFVELDDPSCDYGLQMRFAPSADGDGRTYRARINWLLSDPQSFAPARLTVSLRLAAGRVQDCGLRREGAVPREWPRFVCRTIADDPRAFLGAHVPSAARATLMVELQPAAAAAETGSPPGRLVATQRIDFDISSNGVGNCRSVENRGFPAARIQYGSCGLFLSQNGLVRGEEEGAPRTGRMTMRAFVE